MDCLIPYIKANTVYQITIKGIGEANFCQLKKRKQATLPTQKFIWLIYVYHLN